MQAGDSQEETVVTWVMNNEIPNGHVTEVWAGGTNEGVKKKDLNREVSGEVWGSTSHQHSGVSPFSRITGGESGVIHEVWNTGEHCVWGEQDNVCSSSICG